jgi:hypothetical protein
MHEIIRIDQVEWKGVAKVFPVKEQSKSNVSSLYVPEK